MAIFFQGLSGPPLGLMAYRLFDSPRHNRQEYILYGLGVRVPLFLRYFVISKSWGWGRSSIPNITSITVNKLLLYMKYGSDLISKLLNLTFLSNNHLHWILQFSIKILCYSPYLTPPPQMWLVIPKITRFAGIYMYGKKNNVYYV